MPFAITPRGVGQPPGIRAIETGWPLAPGETFVVDSDPADKVLGANGRSLRDATNEDRTAAKAAEQAKGITDIFGAGIDSGLLQLILRIVLEDIATLRGVTPQTYLFQILRRLE